MPAPDISDNVVIVDESSYMRSNFRFMLEGQPCGIFEAGDESSALDQVSAHHPGLIFVSMENQYWPGLVNKLKQHGCTVVGYCNRISRETVASAYFAGVDDILVSPLKQKERVEGHLMKYVGRYWNMEVSATISPTT